MKDQWIQLINNRALMSAVIAWALAQLLKVAHAKFILKEFEFERFIGPGGMPSSHSATVVALMVSVGRLAGLGSTYFAIAFALAIVVMYDAMSVRRQAGEHAKALNKIIEQLFDQSKDIDEKNMLFKEALGHTPLQVLAGTILGFIVGFTVPIA